MSNKLSDIVDFNPSRMLKKGTIAPFIEMASLPTNTKFIKQIDEKPFSGGSKFKNGDTLFARITPCLENGKTGKVTNLKDEMIGHGSTEFIVMSAKEPEFDEDYIYYFARLPEFREFAQQRMVGTSGRQRVAWQDLADFEFIFPPKEQRKKAAALLNIYDQKIDLNTQINQNLEQIAQALFKSWFVDFDPVRAKVQALSDGLSLEQAELAAMQAISGKTPEELTALSQTQPDRYAELVETAKAFPCEMVEVDGVEIPQGWNLKALDEIANYQNGLALQKFRPEDDEPFLPVVKIAQLRQGYADGEEKAKASIKPECIIDNGDVIFSWSGSLLVDIWCGGKAALNQHLFKVTSKRYPKWFYYFYTKYHLAEFQRIAYDKAVTMGHIKREHLSAAKCIVPNDELLANKTLENILEKIIFNRLENFNLQDTRDLLLPRLLNGEIQL
jgi:putative type I restriction enzyme hindVIIP specificity protein